MDKKYRSGDVDSRGRYFKGYSRNKATGKVYEVWYPSKEKYEEALEKHRISSRKYREKGVTPEQIEYRRRYRSEYKQKHIKKISEQGKEYYQSITKLKREELLSHDPTWVEYKRKRRLSIWFRGEDVSGLIWKMLYAAKQRAKNKDLEFSITFEDIHLNEICPVLGIPLYFNRDPINSKHRADWDSISLDRIDSTKGYIPGNVQTISLRANTLKSNATRVEVEQILNYMKLHGL